MTAADLVPSSLLVGILYSSRALAAEVFTFTLGVGFAFQPFSSPGTEIFSSFCNPLKVSAGLEGSELLSEPRDPFQAVRRGSISLCERTSSRMSLQAGFSLALVS